MYARVFCIQIQTSQIIWGWIFLELKYLELLWIEGTSENPGQFFNSESLITWIINNYWMRLSMISRIIQTEVMVICRSQRVRRITLTEVWIILDIVRKPNPIIVLLHIQNSDRCKKRFAVKRLVRLTFQTSAGHFCCFVILSALRWSRHERPIILFLDSFVE